MNEPQILFPFPAEEMWEKIREVVRTELQKFNSGNKQVDTQTPGFVQKPIFKATEVCAILQISRQTLHMWVKEGVLKAYKIKSRVFFLWTDIEKLIPKETK